MYAKYSTLHEHLRVLRKNRRTVFIGFVCIFGLALLITFISTPHYEGKVQIIIERVEPDKLSSDRSMTKNPEFYNTQIQLIRSPAVARRVVKILELEGRYESLNNPSGPSLLGTISNKVKDMSKRVKGLIITDEDRQTGGNAETSAADVLATKLTMNLKVAPVQGSDITAISFFSPNPVFAALVANTYIKAYLEETLEMKMDATRRNLQWMTQKSEEERLKLQATEKQLQEYMENKNLVTLEDRVTIIPETLSQLGSDLVRAEMKTKENRLLYDKVRRVSGNLDAAETVLSISEGDSLDILRAQILRAEQNIMELSGKYGSKHPVMIKAKGDLDVLNRKRRQEIHRIIQKVQSQYELSLSNENSIRAQLNAKKAEAIELNEKYVEYSALKREMETNRHLFDALQTKIKDQSITGETRPVNVWVAEKANTPRQPVRPIVGLNILLGLIIGLAGGVVSAYAVEYLDSRIKSADGVDEALGLPVLGCITFNSKSGEMNEIVRTSPRSEFAENYNSLHTILLLSSAEAPPKKILVTSSIAGEGKTTTSVNLALTMAKAGNRVIIIDADLRKPTVHKIFKLNNDVGLSSYLAGNVETPIMKKSGSENLAVFPAGPVPPNPYELLNSKRMQNLLLSLEKDFDFIICDSPPILSVADSRQMSQHFNGLILITRAGKTTYPMAQNSIKLLGDVNAKILGIVVNAVHASDQEYYKYYASYINDAAKA